MTSSTRRVPSSVGRPVNVDRITDAILAAASGVTLTASGTPYAGDGILVALRGYGAVSGTRWAPRRPTREAVAAWVARAALEVTRTASPARYFGAWTDDVGILHLDVVEAFSSAEEDRAIRAAFTRGERAIWHAGRRECIPTWSLDAWRDAV